MFDYIVEHLVAFTGLLAAIGTLILGTLAQLSKAREFRSKESHERKKQHAEHKALQRTLDVDLNKVLNERVKMLLEGQSEEISVLRVRLTETENAIRTLALEREELLGVIRQQNEKLAEYELHVRELQTTVETLQTELQTYRSSNG